MAALPPQSTARAWLDYHDGVNSHSTMFRVGPPSGLPSIMNFIDDFFSTQQASYWLLTVIGFRFASDESNVTNPFPWTGAATYGTGAMPTATAPAEVRYVGRSTDGRRVSASVYGYKGATPAIYRLNASTVADVAAAIAVLQSGPPLGIGLTISGQAPVWKNYASFNFNSYWEKEARP